MKKKETLGEGGGVKLAEAAPDLADDPSLELADEKFGEGSPDPAAVTADQGEPRDPYLGCRRHQTRQKLWINVTKINYIAEDDVGVTSIALDNGDVLAVEGRAASILRLVRILSRA